MEYKDRGTPTFIHGDKHEHLQPESNNRNEELKKHEIEKTYSAGTTIMENYEKSVESVQNRDKSPIGFDAVTILDRQKTDVEYGRDENDDDNENEEQYEKGEYEKNEKDDVLKLPTIDTGRRVSLVSGNSQRSLVIQPLFRYDDHPILTDVRTSTIGHDTVIQTPYGARKVLYCDFTASGKSLRFIEDYIRDHVYPTYANTHSSTGHNARQTSQFREEARVIIKNCVNAGKDDVLIFTGSGATSAIHKLAWALMINQPKYANETVVFIGPYEHHSNILPWREYGTKVVRINHCKDTGHIDMEQLDSELKFWKERKSRLLVCMSAASNVTGIITDVDTVSAIAHAYGAFVVFDCASAGPYLPIDMNPTAKNTYKDAVILSPHKFPGGPGTPGILIAKKGMFKNKKPDRVGGGTVRFVTRELHGYVSNIEEREEGGTPEIVGAIRAGLVFKLKEEIGTDVIEEREEDLCQKAFDVWEKNESIIILGNHTAKRLPIFSFLTKHEESGRLIHHNFISTLLSDLFGIQARGGCACAGPYAEDLIGVSEMTARRYLWFLSEKSGNETKCPHSVMEIMKPGFTRLNLSFFLDDDSIDFVIKAVDMVTKHGWKLLPQYTFEIKSGTWKHKAFAETDEAQLESLHDLNFGHLSDGFVTNRKLTPQIHNIRNNQELLQNAEDLFHQATQNAIRSEIKSASLALKECLPSDKKQLRWFLTPHEASNIMIGLEQTSVGRHKYRLPFNIIPPATRLQASNTHSGASLPSTRATISDGFNDSNSHLGSDVRSDRTEKRHNTSMNENHRRRERQSIARNNKKYRKHQEYLEFRDEFASKPSGASTDRGTATRNKKQQEVLKSIQKTETSDDSGLNVKHDTHRLVGNQLTHKQTMSKNKNVDFESRAMDDSDIGRENESTIHEIPSEIHSSYLSQHRRNAKLKKTRSLPYKGHSQSN